MDPEGAQRYPLQAPPEVLQRIGVPEHPRARMTRKIRERNAAAQPYPFIPPEEVEFLRKVPAHPTLHRNLENTIMKNLPADTIVNRNGLKLKIEPSTSAVIPEVPSEPEPEPCRKLPM